MYDLLTQIDAILKGINLATEKIERQAPRMEKNLNLFRTLERLALRWLTLTKYMGLPPNMTVAVDKMSQILVTMRMFQMSLNLMMASNPLTAGIGIAGLIGTAISFSGSILEGY